MTPTSDRNTMKIPSQRARAYLDQFVVFRASRDCVGVRVEGAKKALAFVARMKSLNRLVAVVAVVAFPAEIL